VRERRATLPPPKRTPAPAIPARLYRRSVPPAWMYVRPAPHRVRPRVVPLTVTPPPVVTTPQYRRATPPPWFYTRPTTHRVRARAPPLVPTPATPSVPSIPLARRAGLPPGYFTTRVGQWGKRPPVVLATVVPAALSIVASRTTVLGAGYVHFKLAPALNWDQFQRYHCEWYMDDPAAYEPNLMIGPEAGHCFEFARKAICNVIVFVYDAGVLIAKLSQVITATDPDLTFTTTKTICVTNGTDTSDMVAGCTQVISESDLDSVVATYFAAGNRVLFRRGDTFSGSVAQGEIGDLSQFHYGAYGGTIGSIDAERGLDSNAPLLTITGAGLGGNYWQNYGTDQLEYDVHWRDDQPAGAGSSVNLTPDTSGDGATQDKTILRRRTSNGAGGRGWDVACSIDHFAPAGGNQPENLYCGIISGWFDNPDGYGIFAGVSHFGVINTKINDGKDTHLHRDTWGTHEVIYGNHYSNPAQVHVNKRECYTHRGESVLNRYGASDWIVFSKNFLTNNEQQQFLSIKPVSGLSMPCRYVIIDGNEFQRQPGAQGDVILNNSHVRCRNNRHTKIAGSYSTSGVPDVFTYTHYTVQDPTVDRLGWGHPIDIEISQNSANHDDADYQWAQLVVNGSGSNFNVTVQNNILFAKLIVDAGDTATVAVGSNFVEVGNTDPSTIPDFVSLTDLRLNPGSPCIDAGVAGQTNTQADADGKKRHTDGSPDQGAYEVGAPAFAPTQPFPHTRPRVPAWMFIPRGRTPTRPRVLPSVPAAAVTPRTTPRARRHVAPTWMFAPAPRTPQRRPILPLVPTPVTPVQPPIPRQRTAPRWMYQTAPGIRVVRPAVPTVAPTPIPPGTAPPLPRRATAPSWFFIQPPHRVRSRLNYQLIPPSVAVDPKYRFLVDVDMDQNDVFDVGAVYFGEKDVDGTWRMIPSGNNLLLARRESGAYVTKQTWTP